jgi:hypothetical protein
MVPIVAGVVLGRVEDAKEENMKVVFVSGLLCRCKNIKEDAIAYVEGRLECLTAWR